jgi:hypothetical protein
MRLLLLFLVGCGGSVLQNAPRPDPAVVAGAAAALAGAASLGAPDAAARKAESKVPPAELRPIKSGPAVPADVLDRLDAQARR